MKFSPKPNSINVGASLPVELSASEGVLIQLLLLEKVAQDNGFDVPGEASDLSLSFFSTQVPLRLWLGAVGEGWCVALSQLAVAADRANCFR